MPLPEFMTDTALENDTPTLTNLQENIDPNIAPDMLASLDQEIEKAIDAFTGNANNLPETSEGIQNTLPHSSDATNSSFWQNINFDWLPKMPEFKLRLPEWQDVEDLKNYFHDKWTQGTTWAHSSWETLTLENARNTAAEYTPDYVKEKVTELDTFLDQHLSGNQQYALLVATGVTLTAAAAGTAYVGYKYLKGRNKEFHVDQSDEENNSAVKTPEKDENLKMSENKKENNNKPLLRNSPSN